MCPSAAADADAVEGSAAEVKKLSKKQRRELKKEQKKRKSTGGVGGGIVRYTAAAVHL